MSDNPSGMPAAADNPMAAQQPPAPVASTEGVDVAAGGRLEMVGSDLVLGYDPATGTVSAFAPAG